MSKKSYITQEEQEEWQWALLRKWLEDGNYINYDDIETSLSAVHALKTITCIGFKCKGCIYTNINMFNKCPITQLTTNDVKLDTPGIDLILSQLEKIINKLSKRFNMDLI